MQQQAHDETSGSSAAQAKPNLSVQPDGDPIPFSHRHTFTGYMATVVDLFREGPRGRRILDVPAGAGRVSQALRDLGHDVVCADFNDERNDYVFTDMNERLPFDDNSFDAVICLEGASTYSTRSTSWASSSASANRVGPSSSPHPTS
jgi:SAM-dependent methyltransferase